MKLLLNSDKEHHNAFLCVLFTLTSKCKIKNLTRIQKNGNPNTYHAMHKW